MLSVLNKRFLFVAVRVIERLLWFSVVTIVNSGLHLGCLIKQKKPVAVNNHTAQPSLPYPSSLSGRNGADEKQACHHPLVKKLFWVPPFGGLVAREQHLCATSELA